MSCGSRTLMELTFQVAIFIKKEFKPRSRPEKPTMARTDPLRLLCVLCELCVNPEFSREVRKVRKEAAESYYWAHLLTGLREARPDLYP